MKKERDAQAPAQESLQTAGASTATAAILTINNPTQSGLKKL